MRKILLTLIVIILALVLYFYFSRGKHNNWKIRNSHPQGKTIVCFGDSLTFGYGAEQGMDYPSQLSKLINEPIINMGVSGDTTESALQRIDKVLAVHPKIVMITLGGNDLKNRIPKKEAFDNLEKIISKLHNNGAIVIIGGIEIPFLGKNYTTEYRNIAERTGSVLIPNIYSGILTNPKFMNDRIHPNGKGYAIMAEYFYEAVMPYIGSNYKK